MRAPRVAAPAATKGVEIYELPSFERNQLFLGEMRHFLACLRREEAPLVDLREGRRSLLIGLAAARSLETGRAEEVRDEP